MDRSFLQPLNIIYCTKNGTVYPLTRTNVRYIIKSKSTKKEVSEMKDDYIDTMMNDVKSLTPENKQDFIDFVLTLESQDTPAPCACYPRSDPLTK